MGALSEGDVSFVFYQSQVHADVSLQAFKYLFMSPLSVAEDTSDLSNEVSTSMQCKLI